MEFTLTLFSFFFGWGWVLAVLSCMYRSNLPHDFLYDWLSHCTWGYEPDQTYHMISYMIDLVTVLEDMNRTTRFYPGWWVGRKTGYPGGGIDTCAKMARHATVQFFHCCVFYKILYCFAIWSFRLDTSCMEFTLTLFSFFFGWGWVLAVLSCMYRSNLPHDFLYDWLSHCTWGYEPDYPILPQFM